MHFLIAPDSFKESLTAVEAAVAIKKGVKEIYPEATYTLLPVGDGGEGTSDVLIQNMNLEKRTIEVTAPLGDALKTVHYATDGKTALIEMAEIVGLEQIPVEKRDPLVINTRGLGEFIIKMLNLGINKILVGIGGSASNDGGIGMAAGLGYLFFDSEGKEVIPIGKNLKKISHISDDFVPKELLAIEIVAITDVTNPLCGRNGATYIFGPQKGLREEKLEQVDKMMKDFYLMFKPELLTISGSGAGGGMGAGLMGFANGKLVSGIDYVLDILAFDSKVKEADVVIVGEGQIDGQSLQGKALAGIVNRTPKSIPIIGICGSVGDHLGEVYNNHISAVFPIISQPDSLQNILKSGEENLVRTARNVASLLKLGKQMR